MTVQNKRVTVRVEESLSDSVTLAALAKLLEENGALTKEEVLQTVQGTLALCPVTTAGATDRLRSVEDPLALWESEERKAKDAA
jgi:hypothetical protein